MTEDKTKPTILRREEKRREEKRSPSDACRVLQWFCQDCSNVVLDSIEKADLIINDPKYETIFVSISGGSDSDDVLDLCTKLDIHHKCIYCFFDTGLEYQATKDHLKFLESKYHIEIIREKPVKPIPVSCREFGQPFISKRVSDMISRLQRHNFQWEDEPFDVLYKRYPKCKAALRWWCNKWNDSFGRSQFNIAQNHYLKEFMISNPPTFSISNKCCDYAKKDIVHKFIAKHAVQLNIYGVRKAEGGARSVAYKSCFDSGDKYDSLRPIFWWNNDDKAGYEDALRIVHSDCYVKYGLLRTGCVGCPYARDLEGELAVIQQYEPKLYKAVMNVFGDSYEYTRKYREFAKEMRSKGIKPRRN